MLQCGRAVERRTVLASPSCVAWRRRCRSPRSLMVVLAAPGSDCRRSASGRSPCARPSRPGIGVGIDVQMQQTIAQMRRHRGRARAIVLVIACADHHPAGRSACSPMRCSRISVAAMFMLAMPACGSSSRNRMPSPLVGQPVRAATDGAAVLDPRHAAQLGRVARREIGVDHAPAEITRRPSPPSRFCRCRDRPTPSARSTR